MAKEKYIIHTPEEIKGIRVATRISATILDDLCRAVRPGMATSELDDMARDLIAERGGESAFYNYQGFPGYICISVNEEVVHGIGSPERVLQPGDLISLDCGVRYKGYIGDNARTVCAGPAVGDSARLLTVTKGSLHKAIEAAKGGNSVWDIGKAVEDHVVAEGFSIVRDFVGHGCGVRLHEPPEVPNYPTNKSRETLYPGMVLAIEPMVNIGGHRVKVDSSDGWTVRTVDNSLSAHFEHMVLITEGDAEILTIPESGILP